MGGILEAFLAGKEARRHADAAEQVNAMNAFLGQNGQAIFAGDQNALGQLAGFGPQGLQTALSVKGNLDAAEDRAYRRERDTVTDARADQKWEMELAEYKKGLSAEQAAAEAAALENAAKMALTATSPEQWDELALQNGAEELVGQFENREAVAAQFMSMAEVLKAQETPEAADEYERYVREETAAGRVPLDRIGFKQAAKGKGITQTIRNPDGTETVIQIGGGSEAGTGQTSGDALRTSMTDAQSVIALIDEIDKDPALPKVTGSWMGGGGNNVDEFGTARAMAYGDDGMAVVQKIAQLQGNAWLGARALLKGGGAITDYESKKAEAAMARLSRRQGDKEFKAALKDLKDAIRDGLAKLEGQASGSGSPPTAFDQSEIDALMAGP